MTNPENIYCPICGEPLDGLGFHFYTGQVHCDQAVYDSIDGEEQYRHDPDDRDYGEMLGDGFGATGDFD
jgi:hypothetical protein